MIQAARHGISIANSTLYCTNKPCAICSKMLINAGIARIVYEQDYQDVLAEEMLREAGIEEEKLIP
jgi:dCMP deaminase